MGRLLFLDTKFSQNARLFFSSQNPLITFHYKYEPVYGDFVQGNGGYITSKFSYIFLVSSLSLSLTHSLPLSLYLFYPLTAYLWTFLSLVMLKRQCTEKVTLSKKCTLIFTLFKFEVLSINFFHIILPKIWTKSDLNL